MCRRDPAQRITINAVELELKGLADRSRSVSEKISGQLKPLWEIGSYKGGELIRRLDSIQRLSSEHGESDLQQQVLEDVKQLFARLTRSSYSWELLDRFGEVLDYLLHAINDGFRQYRVLSVASRAATSSSLCALGQSIDELHDILDTSTTQTDQQGSRLRGYLRTQVDLLISVDPPMWLVMSGSESDDNREAFLEYLREEMTHPLSTRGPDEIDVVRQAFYAIANAPFTALSLMKPKWFVPWYEVAVKNQAIKYQGAIGDVYLATWLGSEAIVRMSLVDKTDLYSDCLSGSSSESSGPKRDESWITNDQAWQLYVQEVEIWFSLSHPHLVRLYGACHVGSSPFFVCEYAPEGWLIGYLQSHPDKHWEKLYEVALGVEYLHQRSFVHGTLMGNNVIVANDGKAKVTYFGLSAATTSEAATEMSRAWQWVAPECLTGGDMRPTFQSDVFSIGMCIVEALRTVERALTADNQHHLQPYPWGYSSAGAVKVKVSCGELPPRPTIATDEQWGLVKRMCAFDPCDRMQISDVVDALKALAASQ